MRKIGNDKEKSLILQEQIAELDLKIEAYKAMNDIKAVQICINARRGKLDRLRKLTRKENI